MNGHALQTFDINFVPHHSTLTTSGRSNYSRVVDALAQFVDNSVQACRENAMRREISIRFIFAGSVGSFVIISDNGCGMDKDCLTEYATYGLDPETRGYRAEDGDQSFISKFGVGAKQAGFFLGDRIRVVTKTAESPTVLELVLDRGEFDQRFKSGEEVYRGQIKARAIGATNLTIPPDESTVPHLVHILNEHETSQEQFTATIIRLHADTAKELKLKGYYKDVADELAEIYHFHLHPEHLPNRIVEMDKFKVMIAASVEE